MRHYGDAARLELPVEDLDRAVERREAIVAAVRGAGYRYVTLDLEGLRSGNLARTALRGRSAGPMNARVQLTFPEDLVRLPIVAQLVRRFDVEPNIRRASVEAHEGWIVCELDGAPTAVEDAVSWLEGLGVSVDRLGDVVES